MRIVHLADTHLGYRAYNRITSQGLNRREADVFNAFRSALGKIAELQPDLLIVAGDLFHAVRPSNLCIQHAFGALLDLRAKHGLSAPIVIIGGNHDSPRSADTGCILDLFTNIPDIYVVHHEYAQVRIPNLDTSVFCLCHRALPELSDLKLEPDPGSRYNILALHGTVEGAARNLSDAYTIGPSDILDDRWDYVAAGHYHIHMKLADNAYYSGSTEFTSFNIWEEAGKPKGFIEYDLDGRQAVFHKLQTRRVVDLRPLDAHGLTAAQIDEALLARVEGVDTSHREAIIRLVIESIPRQVQKELDYASIGKLKSEALHLEIQFRRPRRDALTPYSTESGRTRPLEVEWQEFLRDGACIPAGVDPDSLLDMGLKYLAEQETTPE